MFFNFTNEGSSLSRPTFDFTTVPVTRKPAIPGHLCQGLICEMYGWVSEPSTFPDHIMDAAHGVKADEGAYQLLTSHRTRVKIRQLMLLSMSSEGRVMEETAVTHQRLQLEQMETVVIGSI
jgi:hypothetical protein